MYFEYKGYFISIEKDIHNNIWTRASTTNDSIKQVFNGYPMTYVMRKIKKDINNRISK